MATRDELISQARAAIEAAKAQADSANTAAQKAQAALDALIASPEVATAAVAAAQAGGLNPFIYQFAIFIMAIFVGYYVVWSVTPALHTPLMSVTNAISSVIAVGALLAVGVPLVESGTTAARIFGFIALVLAAVNIFGGFLVTERMLSMYKKKD
jgi:NAD(P) transhydrogenase subunit alpha